MFELIKIEMNFHPVEVESMQLDRIYFEHTDMEMFHPNIVDNILHSANLKCNFSLFQSDDAVNPDRLYDLVAVVIHCGSGPNRGHYISIVKSHGFWLLFDDDQVDVSK